MSQPDVAALRDAYEAFSRGEFDVASRILDPNVEWVEHGKGMPYSGTWHGLDSVVNDVWTVFAQHWVAPE
jgi:ketosteroid isomerase-like protein